MGKYAGRITSILTGKKERIRLKGTTFDCKPEQIEYFRRWWKLVNIEHGIVFWLTGAISIILLSFLGYLTVFGQRYEGIDFLIQEAQVISQSTLPVIGMLFLLFGAGMLFSTQLAILDTTSRILTENLTLLSKRYFPPKNIRYNFYIFLWLQIILGIFIFTLDIAQPFTLIVIGAVLNAAAMFVHILLTLWINLTLPHPCLRPSKARISIMAVAAVFL